tara:strand:+ start:1605 stop:1814 length:210 start_codon:yes stop_codon:yes gene_type:complete
MLVTTALEAIQVAIDDLRRTENTQLATTLLFLVAEVCDRFPPEMFLDIEIDMISEACDLAGQITNNIGE